MLLKDQAAIVTGGASGLGAATARKLAAQGAKVAVCDLNVKLAESVAAEIKGVAVACDVADAASAEAAIAAAAKAHGPARVLVNCAGIGVAKRVVGRDGPHPLADFEKVIKINLIGTFNMLRLATADMSKLEPLAAGERGVVINTASVAAYDGQIGQAAYSASKGGIVGMTLPIAREHRIVVERDIAGWMPRQPQPVADRVDHERREHQHIGRQHHDAPDLRRGQPRRERRAWYRIIAGERDRHGFVLSVLTPLPLGEVGTQCRVRGYGRSIGRTPSPQPSPHGRGGAFPLLPGPIGPCLNPRPA